MGVSPYCQPLNLYTVALIPLAQALFQSEETAHTGQGASSKKRTCMLG